MRPRAGVAAARRERGLEAASAGMTLIAAGLIGLTVAGSGLGDLTLGRDDESRAMAARLDRAVDQLEAAALEQMERALAALHLFQPSMPAAPEAAPLSARILEVAEGDTLHDLLTRAGAQAAEAQAAIQAIRPLYDPRRLKIGQEVTLLFAEEGETRRLVEVNLAASVEEAVVARAGEAGFSAQTVARPLAKASAALSAEIEDSLYVSAQRAGAPVPVILELIRLYSYDVDFQRDLQPGDRIQALYETHIGEDGSVAKVGDVLAAKFAVKGTELALYRFRLPDGEVDWFDANGESVRKALLKTPIDGARLSSRFGMRRHPILGYSLMHRGADFAAPAGTPVMAAGDGVVEFAGRNGGYGNYVRLRHDSRHRTAYAHLSRFASGLRAGRRVKQGQVIGYVGSTGRSTGPHLHYEVLVNGEQVNPMGLQLPTGRKLEGRQLAEFQRLRADLDRRLEAAVGSTRTAALTN